MALTDDLEAYYSGEDVTDATGNGYTLTNTNSVAFNSAFIGNGFDFGSTNTTKRLVRTPDIFDYTQFGVGWTMNFWVYAQDGTTGKRITRYILTNGSLERNLQLDFRDDEKIFFGTFDGSSRGITSTSTLSLNTWHMVTIAYDGSMRLYIDGSLEVSSSSFSFGGFGRSSFSCFALGCEQLTTGGSASEYFRGLIDEVGIWRRALTGAEVTELYNAGAGLSYADITGGGGGGTVNRLALLGVGA